MGNYVDGSSYGGTAALVIIEIPGNEEHRVIVLGGSPPPNYHGTSVRPSRDRLVLSFRVNLSVMVIQGSTRGTFDWRRWVMQLVERPVLRI